MPGGIAAPCQRTILAEERFLLNQLMKTPLGLILVLISPLLFCSRLASAVEPPVKSVSPDEVSAKPAGKEALKASLAKMEDDFCAMAKEKGILAAFEHFAAPDVAFIDTDPRKFRGLAAVRERMGPDQPGVSVNWSAMFTDVSDDGTLGYNWGRYEWRSPGPDGKERVRTGFFLTIWKRQPDGTWRYVMDNGAADKPAPPPKPEEKAKL
jgi:ketosteroid isomerase-like protein